MRRQLTCMAVLTAVCVLGGLASGLASSPAAAQDLDEVRKTDEDFGRMIRHPAAYRDELGARRSFESTSEGARYTYRFYDHPKPSFQFFQQGQNYKWSRDLFPGAERRPSGGFYRGRGLPSYNSYTRNTVSVYNTYNTYNYYYPPSGYSGW